MNGPNNSIGWCDFTANPVSGKCLHNCPDCYAERIRVRYSKPEKIQYRPDWFSPAQAQHFIRDTGRTPKIFVGSMHDLWGDWIDHQWLLEVINQCSLFPSAIFQFCTQNPKRYQEFTFPDNCWLGTTVRCDNESGRIDLLGRAKAKIRFVSAEPLLAPILLKPSWFGDFIYCGQSKKVDWWILGCKTPYHKGFDVNWFQQVVDECNYYDVPVWVKKLPDKNSKANGDISQFPAWAQRREFPK